MLLGISPLGYRTLRAACEPATVAVMKRVPYEDTKSYSAEALKAAPTASLAAARRSSPSRSFRFLPSDLRSDESSGESVLPVALPWVGRPFVGTTEEDLVVACAEVPDFALICLYQFAARSSRYSAIS